MVLFRLGLVALALASAPPGGRALGILEPSALPEDEYAETFTFVADLEDGTYLQLQLAVTNIGPGSGTGLCRMLVKVPGEPAFTRFQRVSSGGWSYREDGAEELLSVGGCSARTGERTHVRVALGGHLAEILFPHPASGLEAPGSPVRVGAGEYRSWILQAFSPVRVRLEGFRTSAPLDGGGYADHSRSNLPPAALARRWVRFRALRAPAPLLVLAREAQGGAWDPAWLWRRGESPGRLDAIELARPSDAGGAWLAVLHQGSAAYPLTADRLLHRHAPLDDLGILGALVSPLFHLPVTWTYRATLRAPEPVEGILEVSAFEE